MLDFGQVVRNHAAGWDNRVRSLKCSDRSSLYVYEDKGRSGDYVMTDAAEELTGLRAVMSSYIYFGTYAEEEDTTSTTK